MGASWRRYYFLLISLLLEVSSYAFAQHLPYFYSPLSIYQEGLELFNKQKYSAAIEKFNRYLIESSLFPHFPESKIYIPEAYFYIAVSSFQLTRANAQNLLQSFITEFPSHPKVFLAKFYLGKLFFTQKRYKNASSCLKELTEKELSEEEYSETQFMLGYCYFSQDREEEALEKLNPLRQKLGPYHDEANYYYGVIQFRKKNYYEALNAFQSIEKVPEFEKKVPVYIAACLLETKQYEKLATYGENLLNAKEDFDQKFAIYRSIGAALFEIGMYEKAMLFWEEYANQSATIEPAIRYRMGFACYKLKQFPPAIFHFKKIVHTKDSIAQAAAYYLGQSYLQIQKPDEARLAFQYAHELPFDNDFRRESLFLYAKIAFENKYFDEARSAFEQYIKKYPNAYNIDEVNSLLGEAYYYAAQFRNAIRFFEASGVTQKRTKTAYQKACYYYAIQLIEKSKLDSALFYLQKCVRVAVEPGLTIDARFWIAEIKFYKGLYEEAEAAYQEMIKMQGATGSDYYSEALVGWAWCLMLQKNWQEAAYKFREATNLSALKNKPDLYVVANLRGGDCFFVIKEYQKAIPFYQRVIDFNHTQTDYAEYSLGLCQLRLGQTDAAIKTLKKIVVAHRNSNYRDDALLELSSIYMKWIIDYPNATAYAKQLLEEHPNSDLRPLALKNLGYAALSSENTDMAIKYFKKLLFEHGNYNQKLSQGVLEDLSTIMPPKEFSSVLQDFKLKYPDTNIEVENLAYNAGRDSYLLDKNYPEAIEQLSLYIQNYPQGKYYFEAFLFRGECYAELGQNQKALADFEAVYSALAPIEIKNKAIINAAQLQLKLKRFEEAISLYEKALERIENPIERQPLLLGLSQAYMEQKNYRQASQLFQELLANPKLTQYSRTRISVMLGNALYYQGLRDSALRIFQRVEAESQNVFGAESQYMIARIYLDKKEYDACKKAVLSMKEKYQPYTAWRARAFIVLARYYVALGERFQAMETLKSVIRNADDPSVIQEAKEYLEELERNENLGTESTVQNNSQVENSKVNNDIKNISSRAEITPKPKEISTAPPSTPKEKNISSTQPVIAAPAESSKSEAKRNEASSARISYHLIVGTTTGLPKAREMEEEWKKKGFRVSLLLGRLPEQYRISIFQSSNKAEVEQKRKELLSNGTIEDSAWIHKEEKP
ncbi:MAG: tetratricopeptide repeat protein [Bacteroidia bacterium]|nr:tetratricopeptide repeat protein [Bacteroidia bacterium]MDW8158416.1 tetratricopeptide repeat protein [Bacteroidia bacterium]